MMKPFKLNKTPHFIFRTFAIAFIVSITFISDLSQANRRTRSSEPLEASADHLMEAYSRARQNGTDPHYEYRKYCEEQGIPVSRLRNTGQEIVNRLNAARTETSERTTQPREPIQRTVYQPASTNLGGSLASRIERYSTSAEVNALVRYADSRALSTSHGLCVTWVKMAMMQSNVTGRDILTRRQVIDRRSGRSVTVTSTNGRQRNSGSVPGNPRLENSYPSGVNSLGLKSYLDRSGQYLNLLSDSSYRQRLQNNPELAPRGSILIWSGGDGHAEIRTDQGLVSDYRRNAGGLGRSFRLVGVYIKDMGPGSTQPIRVASN